MPMIIAWTETVTHKYEKITITAQDVQQELYSYYDPATPEGQAALAMIKIALAQKLGVTPDTIPGFNATATAEWRPPPPPGEVIGLLVS